jgi:hypothetical protein
MQISRNRTNQTISLSQHGYIAHLMSRFNINLSNLLYYPKSPMTIGDMSDPTPVPLSQSQQNIFMQLVSPVFFLSTRSRPDISFVVNYISFFMTNANQNHLNLWYKLLKYIWKTKHLSLTFNGSLGINFYIMVDSSYASHSDRKSQYGISVHMNSKSGSCISISKKGTILAFSSTEAEYIAMYEASKVIMW